MISYRTPLFGFFIDSNRSDISQTWIDSIPHSERPNWLMARCLPTGTIGRCGPQRSPKRPSNGNTFRKIASPSKGVPPKGTPRRPENMRTDGCIKLSLIRQMYLLDCEDLQSFGLQNTVPDCV